MAARAGDAHGAKGEPALLEVKDLDVHYGGIHALKGVSFSVDEGQVVTLQDVYLFDYAAGQDHTGRFIGVPLPTGVRPKFLERIHDLGIPLPAGMFDPPAR